jgi:hypothetical protein
MEGATAPSIKQTEMKYLIIIFAALLTSCSDEACCIVSKEAAKDALYDGQFELCYGEPTASRLLSKDDWVEHMESLGCHCTY